MDICFYWLRDRVRQENFYVHWKKASKNLADYVTKYHSTKHHVQVRPDYVSNAICKIKPENLYETLSTHTQINPGFRYTKLQGCVNSLTTKNDAKLLIDQFSHKTRFNMSEK